MNHTHCMASTTSTMTLEASCNVALRLDTGPLPFDGESDRCEGENVAEFSTDTRVKKGEDFSATLRATVGGDTMALILVADGHGGAAAAELVSSRMLQVRVTHAIRYLLRSSIG